MSKSNPKMDLPGLADTTNSSVAGDTHKLISDHVRIICEWIFSCVICQAIAIFGTVTNIINMICFIKQGFKDPVNVSLFGLAISDLGSLLTLIWLNICVTPAFTDVDLPFDIDAMIYLGSGWPHCIFARVTSFLTAFITLERCLCISLPLKVKSIFTSKRVAAIVISFFIILIVSVSPIYYVNRFEMVFNPLQNKTILGIAYTEDRMDVIKVTVTINNIIIPIGAFAIIILCTGILVINLNRKTKWRQTAGAAGSEMLLNRDQKVAKMVLTISGVFIFCFIPSCVNFLVLTLEPRIEMYGQYSNTFIVLFMVSFILEAANSSVNIFVYYNMSSKFRTTFRDIFGFRGDVGPI